eukprot:CAMPEP_0169385004 /NCGR_PEP_ID=MMETSP1017-20121227/43807_1 /TAXON_ID=342587 /ORGANISM="Karlodinium micrum, Strain CCMP2283" /LENGTH=124 /DNA_ID=CAMNT_0009485755 /DNA_START=179 /DNA_END=553 /DNA_ORIENTATION=-
MWCSISPAQMFPDDAATLLLDAFSGAVLELSAPPIGSSNVLVAGFSAATSVGNSSETTYPPGRQRMSLTTSSDGSSSRNGTIRVSNLMQVAADVTIAGGSGRDVSCSSQASEASLARHLGYDPL